MGERQTAKNKTLPIWRHLHAYVYISAYLYMYIYIYTYIYGSRREMLALSMTTLKCMVYQNALA